MSITEYSIPDAMKKRGLLSGAAVQCEGEKPVRFTLGHNDNDTFEFGVVDWYGHLLKKPLTTLTRKDLEELVEVAKKMLDEVPGRE